MTPIAVLPITNSVTLNIYAISNCIEDLVMAGFDDESVEGCTIFYDDEDDAVFSYRGEEYRISDFIRVEL